MNKLKRFILVLIFLLTSCNNKQVTDSDDSEIEYADPVYYYEFDVYQQLSGTIEEKISNILDSFVTDGQSLIDNIDGNGHIDWSVVSGNITIQDNVIKKNEDALDNEPVVLKAHYIDENNDVEYICKENICLDGYAGYVLSYFSNEGEDSQTLKIAYSYDGFLWYDVNNHNSVYQAKSGTGYLRDPSFIRLKDGGFKLVATQGWDNPSIYVIDTNDFVNYNNEQLVQLNISSEQLQLSETQAWAPEGFYDYNSDQYYIYYSSVNDEKILYNTTSDFINYSLPDTLIDLGYPIIDATIFKQYGHYYVLVKDEREPMENYSYLMIGSSSTDFLSFDKFSGQISRNQAEGPFIMEDSYHLIMYYDDYTRQQYEKMWIDPENGSITMDDSYTNINAFAIPSHGAIIRVTWDEMASLVNE